MGRTIGFVALTLAVAGYGQVNSHTVAQGNIGPSATVKTAAFLIAADEELSVETSGQSGVPYVITEVFAQNAQLIEKEPEQPPIARKPFVWRASKAGSYFLRMRNLSEAPGAFTITLTRLPARSAAAPDKTLAEMRLFYATNRKPTGEGRPEYFYGKEPKRATNCTSAKCRLLSRGRNTQWESWRVQLSSGYSMLNLGSLRMRPSTFC